ncbi:hypothetical protein SAMN05216330_12354 [Bradyrhizobium sp. Ghvi]|nr:hypothetical protein SAMN05216330_12354 [Bradyrhizobium sp. Ghvi]
MNKLLLTTSIVALISTGAMAQSTVVTTTGTARATAVQIEPEYRTKIRTYVTKSVPWRRARRSSSVSRCRAKSSSRLFLPTGVPRLPSIAMSTRASA